MWTSLGKSIGDFVEERFTSPLISSFALAWAAVNYKFFVILFSRESVASSFILIGDLFPDWKTRLLNGFAIPLGIALFYLFVFPYPSQWVYKHWRRNLQKTDKIKQEYESAKRLTVEESRQLRQQINELEVAADSAASVIRGLRTDLQTAYDKSAQLEAELAKLPTLQAALDATQAEKLAKENEVKLQLEQNSKLRVEATMANERLVSAETRIAAIEEQTRVANVQAFARAVFDFGANDRLTANQSKRLKDIFAAAERGDRDLSNMYKTIFHVLTQALRNAAGQQKNKFITWSNDQKSTESVDRAAVPLEPSTQAATRTSTGAALSPVSVKTVMVPAGKPPAPK